MQVSVFLTNADVMSKMLSKTDKSQSLLFYLNCNLKIPVMWHILKLL